MNCRECLELMDDYLDNDLEDWKRHEVTGHLAQCLLCQAEMAEIQEGMRLYHQWGTAVEPSAEFVAGVMKQLAGLQPASSIYPLFRAVSIGLLVILLAGILLFAPVLYPIITVIFELAANLLPLPGIFLAAFPVAQSVSMALLATMLVIMTWAMRRVMEY
jgi:anti-sigma factor RsiW